MLPILLIPLSLFVQASGWHKHIIDCTIIRAASPPHMVLHPRRGAICPVPCPCRMPLDLHWQHGHAEDEEEEKVEVRVRKTQRQRL